jgi:hypothetical protein
MATHHRAGLPTQRWGEAVHPGAGYGLATRPASEGWARLWSHARTILTGFHTQDRPAGLVDLGHVPDGWHDRGSEIFAETMSNSADSKRPPIDAIERELAELERHKAKLVARLEESRVAAPKHATALSPQEKVRLFREVFRGRPDVYAERFVAKKTGKAGYGPVCANKFVKGLCELPKVKCGDCANRALRSLDDRAVERHLRGHHVLGIYPLLEDETCWLLAMDFDKSTWMQDASAVWETCSRLGIPAYVERSRSGEGAHVWFFFAAPIPASLARKLGSHVLTETMSAHPGLSFDSYDRLFPNQDTMPAGGFGNLIALPLQHEARQQDNSVFVGTDWKPVRSQWGLLQQIERIDVHRVEGLVKRASRARTILGVRSISEDDEGEDEAPWLRAPSGTMPTPTVREPLPASLHATLSQRLFVDKQGLPSALVAQIRRLAAFQCARRNCRSTVLLHLRGLRPASQASVHSGSKPGVLQEAGDAALDVENATHHLLRREPRSARRAPARVHRKSRGARPPAWHGSDARRPSRGWRAAGLLLQGGTHNASIPGARNAAILEDIIGTLVEGRSPIVLTQRREHLEWFAERVRPYARNVAVLKGGMGKRAEQEARETLASATADGSTVLVATGPYVGEGFDDPRLDTLFWSSCDRLHGVRGAGGVPIQAWARLHDRTRATTASASGQR